MRIKKFVFFTEIILLLTAFGCTNRRNAIKEIHIDKYNDNFLKISIQIETFDYMNTWISYWPVGQSEKNEFVSSNIPNTKSHRHVLLNIQPNTKYNYQIHYSNSITHSCSKIYQFTSPSLPLWLQNQFLTLKDSTSNLPSAFTKGFMLLNKRESPGCSYLVDYKGRIRWYHMVDGEGVKVTHFTDDKTILSILGTNDEPTSYGSEILEINLMGDTINYLKKNTGDLKYQIHHEIIKDHSGNYVTLFVDKRIVDLSKYGGLVKDTVTGDGILIINNKGKAIYKWSVFNVMSPLSDTGIIRHKRDWMHANSVNYDTDGNFLISFYNNGQIWKIDAHTSKVIWKFGKDGNIKMPIGCNFSQAHAVHMTKKHVMMFFNNGIDKKISEGYGIKINERLNTSEMVVHVPLPPDIYNDRMGSMYQISDSLFLCCSSKRKIAILANKKGTLLWDMETAVPSYRIEFISEEKLHPYLQSL